MKAKQSSKMSVAEKRLPKVVDMVGERIGLNYNIPRHDATEAYVSDHERLDLKNLRYSSYSLSESKTKKTNSSSNRTNISRQAKNPLKLNAKIRKSLYRISTIEKTSIKYSTMRDIHDIWVQYANKLLATTRDSSIIYKLDLHGCLLKCVASKNPTFVMVEGIVIQETKNTFILVLKTDRIVTLPKRDSIFEFDIDDDRYRIHGCNLMQTVQARSKSKYKTQRLISDV